MTRFWCFPRVAPIDGESSDREDDTGSHEGVRANQAEFQYGAANARLFELNELIVATNNFDPQLVLGEGKLGRVYKGKLGYSQDVAVKKLKKNTKKSIQQERAEFLAQVEMLSRLEHSNLVKLIGLHDNGDDLCFIYEFMPHRSLDLQLYGHEVGKKPLDWKTRMKIAKGVAKALQYLHDQKDPPVLFGDLKASSILLMKILIQNC
ncbi:probable serine/threonine-protein kinase PBL25 isoform X1 [Papaver somniferum]|uniref:probable serine/threonine-protein kinase PBL25 isoform X1 n=1 Tax=Papaver somniferum TaxID=3469 RepID=UPI000E6F6C6D|nr:probable serine/threonine-protein kinase PBL25 isoform X1 [Papaver somniferum]